MAPRKRARTASSSPEARRTTPRSPPSGAKKSSPISPSAPRALSSRRIAQCWPPARVISLVSSTRACATQRPNSCDRGAPLAGARGAAGLRVRGLVRGRGGPADRDARRVGAAGGRPAQGGVRPCDPGAAVESALGGFEELPPQSASGAQVLALVQEDRLVAKNEEAVFRWVARWWEAGERPEAELLAVMKHVRFATMDAVFVTTTVRAWPALRSLEGSDAVVDSFLDAGRALRRSGLGPRLIYVVGGGRGGEDDPEETLDIVELYDPQAASWKQLASLPNARYSHGCAALEGKIYVVGGIGEEGQQLDTGEVYDPQTDRWQPLAEIMSTLRCEFGLASVSGKIYAIGGWDGVDRLQGVEAYDPQLGSWAQVASMSGGRSSFATVVMDGKVYAMGGLANSDGPKVDTVEVYDPQADSWQLVASMPEGRSSPAATAIGDKIYVTGGCDGDQNATRTVCVYDPQTDAWAQLASMRAAREDHTSTVVGGKLYVFGGRDARGDIIVTAEVYDPASDSWTQGTSLTFSRFDHVAVAL
eukprot:scaffold130865_cov69-Phaeocystis_antarctica.AAC.3